MEMEITTIIIIKQMGADKTQRRKWYPQTQPHQLLYTKS